MRLARVGGQDAWSAGVGQDRDPRTGGERLTREQARDVEQLFHRFGANDASLPEERVHDGVLRGEAPVCDDAARAPEPERPP